MTTPAARYSSVAMTLHWATALLILANLLLGLSMVRLSLSPTKLQWYLWHKWIGITVFIVTCARLAWRARHRPPVPVAMPEWQRRASHWSRSDPDARRNGIERGVARWPPIQAACGG